MAHGIQRLCLRGDAEQRLAVWQLAAEQRQAFNRGVELCLKAVEANERVPSKYDLHKQITADRKAGVLPSDVSVQLQRGGIEGGRQAVLAWSKARWKMDSSVVYWAVRRAAAEAELGGDADRAKILRKAVNVRSRKPDAKVELAHCKARLDKAEQKRDVHVERGTGWLFRSRKHAEAVPGNAAAVVLSGGAVLSGGKVHIPKGPALELLDGEVELVDGRKWDLSRSGSEGLPEGWRWTGAIQIVDATRRVTAATEPRHRRWVIHAQLERTVPVVAEVPASSPEQVLGCDAGCVTNMALSAKIPVAGEGLTNKLDFPGETETNHQIKELQQRKARLTNGSRAHKKISRKIKQLYAKRSRRRDNAANQIAAAIASAPGVTAVGVEQTSKNMNASAKGTAEHPGKGVAAKRALNRKLSDAWFNGIRARLERACAVRGVAYVEVAAFGTSQFCHVCGHRVARESQSSYWCQPCGVVGDADPNAACNIAELTWQTLKRGEPVTMATMDSSPAARGSPSQEERAAWIPAQQGNSTDILDGCVSDAEFLPNKAASPIWGNTAISPQVFVAMLILAFVKRSMTPIAMIGAIAAVDC